MEQEPKKEKIKMSREDALSFARKERKFEWVKAQFLALESYLVQQAGEIEDLDESSFESDINAIDKLEDLMTFALRNNYNIKVTNFSLETEALRIFCEGNNIELIL